MELTSGAGASARDDDRGAYAEEDVEPMTGASE